MNAASHAFSDLRENVRLDFDTDKLNDHVMDILRDTGAETLQPEYLHQQMREARSDLRELIHQLSMNPSDMEKFLSQFVDKEKERLESLTKDIDRETAVHTLMTHRNIPQDEAEKMVDDAVSAYRHAVGKAKESLSEARTQVEDARRHVKEMSDRAREKADDVSSAGGQGRSGRGRGPDFGRACQHGGRLVRGALRRFSRSLYSSYVFSCVDQSSGGKEYKVLSTCAQYQYVPT